MIDKSESTNDDLRSPKMTDWQKDRKTKDLFFLDNHRSKKIFRPKMIVDVWCYIHLNDLVCSVSNLFSIFKQEKDDILKLFCPIPGEGDTADNVCIFFVKAHTDYRLALLVKWFVIFVRIMGNTKSVWVECLLCVCF